MQFDAALLQAPCILFTLVAQRGIPTQITFINNLVSPFLQNYPMGATPIFAVDQTLNWADPLNQFSQFTPYGGPVPVCVHLHGGEVPSAFDGGPDAWFTPNSPGNTKELRSIVDSSQDMQADLVQFYEEAGKYLESGDVFEKILALASQSRSRVGERFFLLLRCRLFRSMRTSGFTASGSLHRRISIFSIMVRKSP